MLYPFGAIPPEFSNHLNKFESQPDASDPLREVKTSAARWVYSEKVDRQRRRPGGNKRTRCKVEQGAQNEQIGSLSDDFGSNSCSSSTATRTGTGPEGGFR
jgi:hypothetical protein